MIQILVRRNDGSLALALGPLSQKCFREAGRMSEIILLIASWSREDVSELHKEISNLKAFVDQANDAVGDILEVTR